MEHTKAVLSEIEVQKATVQGNIRALEMELAGCKAQLEVLGWMEIRFRNGMVPGFPAYAPDKA